MAKIQFNRAVRISPRAGKGTPKVYAAGSVHDISDPEILKHPHFLKFKKAGALQEFVAAPAPKVLAPAVLGASKKNPSAVDGRLKLPGVGGQLKVEADKKAAATKVVPETTVGDDEDDEDLDQDEEESDDDGDDSDHDDDSDSGGEDSGDADEESPDEDGDDAADEPEAKAPADKAPTKKKKAKKRKSK